MKKSVILVLTVLIAIVFSNTILAQGIITSNDGKEELSNNLNPRLENRFGKNMNLLGPSVLVSFSID
jgi:flagellum-specific peptidoglycan hydrolase FlgJ